MDLTKAIYEWIPWLKGPKLEALPFEELQNRYREAPQEDL